ncbi:MAG TPA: transporter substrate-binding domain-containing protein [Lacunisphaera sp.]
MNTPIASRILRLVAMILLLPAPFVVGAESSTLDLVRQRGQLLVGSKQSFPVFNLKDPATGRNEGFFADLARALAKRILGDENKVGFVLTTDENRFEKVVHGEVDVLIDTIPINDEKLKVADYSPEIFRSGSAFLVRKGSPIRGLADIGAGTRIAYVKANEDIAVVRARAPGATYLEFAKSEEALQALKDGKADAFTQVVTHLYRAASQDANYTLVGRFTTKPYHIFLKKGDVGLQAYLDGFMQDLRASGEYDRLYQKWFTPYGGAAVR